MVMPGHFVFFQRLGWRVGLEVVQGPVEVLEEQVAEISGEATAH
jgi:hypothetical protein